MTVSQYFNKYHATNEQALYESLLIESIRLAGIDMVFLPRENQKLDLIFGEDVLSKFTKTYEMEMYVKSFDQFGGQGEFISKFGLEIEDVLTLIVSKSVFENTTNGVYNAPREGDLVYFPIPKAMFEIKYVETERPFYQNGKLFLYEIRLEKFRYSNEKIVTGDPEIDDEYIDELAYSFYLTLGTGAGDYTIGEQVYQGANLATATAKGEVIEWKPVEKQVKIKFVSGAFALAQNVIGNTSGATYLMTAGDPLDNQQHGVLTDNKQFEEEAHTDQIGNFDESDPFGNF